MSNDPLLIATSENAATGLPRRSLVEEWSKRAIDVLGAAGGILLLSPLLAVLAVLVKVNDGGPIFHRRRVIGSGGEFDAFKFRTMKVDADRILHQNPALLAEYRKNFKLENDPRVTPLGTFLRKHSLDELPQLFNVLFGQMSLVGPRMITAPELEKYEDKKDLIFNVKPGITGYWQVNGRQNVSYSERVAMDTYYVQNWSLWLDLKILLQTPWKAAKGEGAY